MARASPFLEPGSVATRDSLAILHLRRDQQLSITLRHSDNNDQDDDFIENTRFGSYPHSTLLNVPWGSQILASKVNTGKGFGKKARRAAESKKRSLEDANLNDPSENSTASGRQQTWSTSTGFCHILPPTPEAWTISLPHRTQVVYTPDYSFILQKLRARPGSVLIEAGAGSGSFTHAAARAVFGGSSSLTSTPTHDTKEGVGSGGKVFSFEYHAPRAEQLRREVVEHGLEDVVSVTHRDVYADGFLLDGQTSPRAAHIFLDLPDPAQALPHLTRTPHATSPLDPERAAYISLFLPCIEQVTKAVAEMRRFGWVDIQMFDLAHRRIDVRREHIGLDLEGQRGVNATPATVGESIARLHEVEERQREYRGGVSFGTEIHENPRESKQDRRVRLSQEAKTKKMYREGTLSHRSEPELRTHTSYLVFGVLPREWTQEHEQINRQKYPINLCAS